MINHNSPISNLLPNQTELMLRNKMASKLTESFLNSRIYNSDTDIIRRIRVECDSSTQRYIRSNESIKKNKLYIFNIYLDYVHQLTVGERIMWLQPETLVTTN